MKKLVLIVFIILTSLTSAYAGRTNTPSKKGGATSGGGDLLGIDETRVAHKVIEVMHAIGSNVYSQEQLKEVTKIKSELKILIVDEELPTTTNAVIQKGAAFSIRENNTSTIFLKRDKWNSITSLLEREVLMHHELMVLAGIEETGDYTYSMKFEDYRKNYWKLIEHKGLLCTINVFQKNENSLSPGELIGSSSSKITFSGAQSDSGLIKIIDKYRALIWRGAIGSSGHFLMEISEVVYAQNHYSSNPKDLIFNLNDLTVKEKMRTYSDPYQIGKAPINPIYYGDNYIVIVNCNHY